MPKQANPTDVERALAERTEILFQEQRQRLYRHTDQLFGGVLASQWLAALALALWLSPQIGTDSQTHDQVWAAVGLGGAIIIVPLCLAFARPGRTSTRYAIGVGQMLLGALIIYLSGGRVEMHFHIFGSLALLAFYRDCGVLLTASAVVAADHLLRGWLWPQSVYAAAGTEWRWLEHLTWVVFIDAFLIGSCQRALAAMRALAQRHAQLEASHAGIETQVQERTRALQVSQQRTAAILESALDGIITMDDRGRILEFNAAAERMFGYRKADLLGQELVGLIIPAGQCEQYRQDLACYRETGQSALVSRQIEVTACTAEGTELPIELNISPVRTDGQLLFTAMLRDISARKRIEAALRAAKEAAESGSRAKTDFLAAMSHEIRTPMNGVIGMAGLLLETPLSPHQREIAEIVRSSGDNLLAIINDILDCSKIEAGMLRLDPVGFDLRQASEDVAAMLAARAKEKNLDLVVRYDPQLASRFVGDPGRIRQVLINLVGNALKFTEKGHVLLEVTRAGDADGLTHVSLAVTDTGIGIARDQLDMIFERFTQADRSTTRRYGGTGLGLPISKHLVEIMGGSLTVTSRPGEGSTFRFTLPLPVDRQGPAPSAPSADLAGLRVLIVDDNEVNRRVLHEQISSWGMRNGAFASGPEALEILRRAKAEGDPYQIALIDYAMPEIDGEALGRAIKADAALKHTVLVMLTSMGHEGDSARFQEAGFSGFLVKPVRAARLLDTLVMVWSNRARPSATSAPGTSAPGTALRASETPTASHAVRYRALVVDDNAVNQKTARLLLERLECQVDVAGNGQEAVALAQQHAYDLVFMDCEMPEMDGYEATVSIRGLPGPARTVPIIAMTANAMQADRDRCVSAGMDDYISKPTRLEDFQRILGRWGMRRSGSRASAPGLTPRPADAPATSSSQTLDPAVVRRWQETGIALGSDVLGELFEAFAKDAPERLQALAGCLAAQDPRGVYAAAHALRGACANLGAQAMAGLCRELESHSHHEGHDGAAGLLNRLEREYARVRGEIQACLLDAGKACRDSGRQAPAASLLQLQEQT